MKYLAPLLFLIFLFITLTGCGNILYLSKLGWHQSYIIFHSTPVQEILEDGQMDAEVKKKIRFIQEVKRYGEEKLGLRRTKSYSKFFEVKGPILYIITACEKDHLQLHSWNFPLIGRVTYKSFFTRDEASKEKRLLDQRGFDTFMQSVGAYSTLGWLKDPIFSSMLRWNEPILTNIILHEMSHVTIYLKGETDFNEQIATFIGNQGAIRFLGDKYGEGSKEVAEATHNQEDDILFARWIDQACERLSKFYAKKISREEKLRGREEIFQSIKDEFRGIKGQLKTDCYKGFEKMDLNNAVLLAYRRYIHRLENFEAIYEHSGRDLRRVIEFFKEIRASGEPPSSFLDRWMTQRGINVPSSLQ